MVERLAPISVTHVNHPPFFFLYEALMLCEHSEQFQAFENIFEPSQSLSSGMLVSPNILANCVVSRCNRFVRSSVEAYCTLAKIGVNRP
jgi:hypothetical protein